MVTSLERVQQDCFCVTEHHSLQTTLSTELHKYNKTYRVSAVSIQVSGVCLLQVSVEANES